MKRTGLVNRSRNLDLLCAYYTEINFVKLLRYVHYNGRDFWAAGDWDECGVVKEIINHSFSFS